MDEKEGVLEGQECIRNQGRYEQSRGRGIT